MNLQGPVKKLPPKLVLCSVLSGGLTIGFSLIYFLLSLTYLLFRGNCSAASSPNGADYFWTTIFKVYVLSDDCEASLRIERLTQESTVLILVSLILSFSVLCLIAAIGLITIIQDESKSKFVSAVAFTYIGLCVASLVVDLTTASFFGIDYGYLTSLLRILTAGSPSNYKLEVIRQGVFWLMTIALKGYIYHVVNAVFLALLGWYVVKYERNGRTFEHSIHKLGAMHGYEAPGSSNPGYVEDTPQPPRSPMRLGGDHMSNTSFDRSDPWNHSVNSPAPSSRPFSYLEEVRRPAPLKLQPPPPVVEPGWRREQNLPSPRPLVPAPDYSPPQSRRLKSVLKPSYF